MSVLITNIGELVTNDAERHRRRARSTSASGAALVIEAGGWPGSASAAGAPAADCGVDAGGRAVMPGFVDSHAHLVFAGERGAEFAARMAGEPYTGGGIRTTVAATRAASDEAAAAPTCGRLRREMLRAGHHDDRDQVRVRADRGRRGPQRGPGRGEFTREITYLGAHVVPAEYADDTAGYVDLVCGAMLAACAPYARWVDVFCEKGAFDADQAARGADSRGRGRAAPAGARQPARPRAGRRSWRSSSARPAPTTARTSTPATSTRWPARARSPRCCPGRSSPPGRPTRTRARCSTPGPRWPRHRLQPGSSYTSSMPFCIALAVREMRMTTGRGGVGGDRGRRAGAAPRRRRPPGRRRAGRPRHARRALATCTWPTGPGCR